MKITISKHQFKLQCSCMHSNLNIVHIAIQHVVPYAWRSYNEQSPIFHIPCYSLLQHNLWPLYSVTESVTQIGHYAFALIVPDTNINRSITENYDKKTDAAISYTVMVRNKRFYTRWWISLHQAWGKLIDRPFLEKYYCIWPGFVHGFCIKLSWTLLIRYF